MVLKCSSVSLDVFHVTLVVVTEVRRLRTVVLDVFSTVVLRRLTKVVQTGPRLALGQPLPPFTDGLQKLKTIYGAYTLLTPSFVSNVLITP